MTLSSSRRQWAMGLGLAVLMLATRGQHVAGLNLPSASWAVFFLAGLLLPSRSAFPALFAAVVVLDIGKVALGLDEPWCLSPAYPLLLPAYAALWWGGRLGRTEKAPLSFRLFWLVPASALIAYLFSAGGFYFLSGQVSAPDLAGFIERAGRFYPRQLLTMSGYVLLAAAGVWSLHRRVSATAVVSGGRG